MQILIVAALLMICGTALFYFNSEILIAKIEAVAHLGLIPSPAWFRSFISVTLVSIIVFFVSGFLNKKTYEKEGRYLNYGRPGDIIFALGLNNSLFPSILFLLENYNKVIDFVSKCKGDSALAILMISLAIIIFLLLIIAILWDIYSYSKNYNIHPIHVLSVFLLHGLAVYWVTF